MPQRSKQCRHQLQSRRKNQKECWRLQALAREHPVCACKSCPRIQSCSSVIARGDNQGILELKLTHHWLESGVLYSRVSGPLYCGLDFQDYIAAGKKAWSINFTGSALKIKTELGLLCSFVASGICTNKMEEQLESFAQLLHAKFA